MSLLPVAIDTSAVASSTPDLVRLIVDTDRCKGCELCVRACSEGVLALDRGHVNALGYNPVTVVAASRCTSCALCARVCPDAVFTVLAPRPTRVPDASRDVQRAAAAHPGRVVDQGATQATASTGSTGSTAGLVTTQRGGAS